MSEDHRHDNRIRCPDAGLTLHKAGQGKVFKQWASCRRSANAYGRQQSLVCAGTNWGSTQNPGSLTRLGDRSTNSIFNEVLATCRGREQTSSTAMQLNRPPVEILIAAGGPTRAERPTHMVEGQGRPIQPAPIVRHHPVMLRLRAIDAIPSAAVRQTSDPPQRDAPADR